MIYLDISQARSNLTQLLELAINGQEITIVKNKTPVVKISPIQNLAKNTNIGDNDRVKIDDSIDKPPTESN